MPNHLEALEAFIQPCPCCTEIRAMVRGINTKLVDMQDTCQATPHVGPIEIGCSACQDTGEVLTVEGQKLLKAFMRHVQPSIERLEDFTRIANKEASEKVGITDPVPF